jgi:tRNA threonylcarbamoyladenosine biosynthesis protein TsaB
MKILALDTATEACSVALWIDGQMVTREMEFERGHAEHVLPMVDAVLGEGGIALPSLDAIAFGRGPGGFTGVRLAASVTQGLAFGAGLPVVPISDLMAVAQRALDMESSVSRVLVCNDARMNEVYWACFERGPVATPVGVEHVGAPSTVVLPSEWTGPVGAAGRGFRAYAELRSKVLSAGVSHPPVVQLISDDILPRAHEIARLAVPEVQAGRVFAPENAMPVYLRDEVAKPPPSSN